MVRKYFFVFVFGALLYVAFFNPSSTFAACANPVTVNCQYDSQVDGIDSGTTPNTAVLTVNSGTLTIPSGNTLAVGSLKITGGAVVVVTVGGVSGKLLLGSPIWMVDADADGYPASTTHYITQPAGGRRLSAIAHPTITETCDSIATRNPGQTGVFHTTIATDGSWDFNCDGVVTQQYTTASYLSQQYVCNTTGCAAHYYTIKNGWTTSTAIPACGVTDTYKTTTGQSATTCAVLDSTATCANTVTSGSLTQGCY